ncbi:DUF975 family protein [Bacillus sp. 165]|nr:DUF975 family protein [Bacillus sp. 165]MBO9130058.1 DUF975 family protein [Bacillus sp. 165]
MDGYKWKLFLLGLSFIGWGLVCIITLGIAAIWVVPYYTASLAQFYVEISQNYKEKNQIAL